MIYASNNPSDGFAASSLYTREPVTRIKAPLV